MLENAQAISFCNNKVRPMADLMSQTYYTSKALVNFWFANNVPGIIPSDGTVIDDGATADGRQILTGVEVYALVVLAQAFIANYEANSNTNLNTVVAISVNGGAKF